MSQFLNTALPLNEDAASGMVGAHYIIVDILTASDVSHITAGTTDLGVYICKDKSKKEGRSFLNHYIIIWN